MSDILSCEKLATKAELQELRDQINNLLGKKEEGGEPIDVLTKGNLFGTEINSRLIEDFSIEIDSETGEVQTMFFVGGEGGKVPSLRESATAAMRSLVDFGKFAVKTGKLGWNLATNADRRAAFNEKTWRLVADMIDSNETLRSTEVAIRSANRRKKSLLELLDKNDGDLVASKQDIEDYRQDLEDYNLKLDEVKGEIIEHNSKITELEYDDFLQKDAIAQINQDVIDLTAYLNQNTLMDNQLKEDLKLRFLEMDFVINSLQEEVDLIFEFSSKTSFRLYETELEIDKIIEDSIEIKKEQDNLELRLVEVENFIKDPDSINQLPSITPATTTDYIIKRSRSSSGADAWSRDNVIRTQKFGIDLADKLTGNNSFFDPTFEDTVKNPNLFSDAAENLLSQVPDVTNFTTTDPNTTNPNDVTPKDIEKVISAIVADQLVPPLNDIQTKTSKDAIKSAASDAICDQSNNPNSCLNTQIKQPLQNGFNKGLNDLFNKLNAALNAAILAQGNKILGIVKDTNQVLKNSLLGSVADKVLNALNTALLVHNAAMLSSQIGETIGDIASSVLDSVGIKDSDGNAIDVNGVIKTKLVSLLQGLLGEANYQSLTQKIAASNRIYQAGQNIVNDTIDLFDATHQVLEQTGGNVARIGNSLREAGGVEFDAYEEMNEEVRASSKVFKRLEFVEDTTDSAYSIVSDIADIKDTIASISENREEFDEAIEEFSKEASEAEAEREQKIEGLE